MSLGAVCWIPVFLIHAPNEILITNKNRTKETGPEEGRSISHFPSVVCYKIPFSLTKYLQIPESQTVPGHLNSSSGSQFPVMKDIQIPSTENEQIPVPILPLQDSQKIWGHPDSSHK